MECIDHEEFAHDIDLSYINLSSGRVSVPNVENVKFAGAELPNVTFTSEVLMRAGIQTFQDVSFDGANLRGSIFNNPRFRNVSFRGANISGVHFMIPYPIESNSTIDFTDSNVTAEQYDSWVRIHTNRSNSIIINKYSVESFAALVGEDPDTIGTLVWLGEIETRNRTNNLPVSPGTNFDPEEHYIPQWVAQTYNL